MSHERKCPLPCGVIGNFEPPNATRWLSVLFADRCLPGMLSRRYALPRRLAGQVPPDAGDLVCAGRRNGTISNALSGERCRVLPLCSSQAALRMQTQPPVDKRIDTRGAGACHQQPEKDQDIDELVQLDEIVETVDILDGYQRNCDDHVDDHGE